MELDGLFWVRLIIHRNLNKDVVNPTTPPCPDIEGVYLNENKQTKMNNLEQGNDANRLLAAAAIWWERLTPLKKELFESNYGKIDNQKINHIYKMHTDWSNEDLEQVSSCR